MIRFGLAWDKDQWVLPVDLARVMHDDLHADHVRYLIQRPHIEPHRGEFDFSFVDETFANARAVGLEVVPNLYFYPTWVSGDTMTSYDCECSRDAVPLTEAEAPQCYDEIPIDSDAIYESTVSIARHFRDMGGVNFIGVDNEPGVRNYWLSSRDDTPESSIERWYRKCAVPTMDAFRSVLPDVEFVSQFDAFAAYGHCVKTFAPVSFKIGGHPYADVPATPASRWITDNIDVDATTDAVIAKVRDEFIARAGRLDWITEIQHCDNARLLRETGLPVTDHNPARYVDLDTEWYRDAKGTLTTRAKSKSGTWKLTPDGEKLRRDLGDVVLRRRHAAEVL